MASIYEIENFTTGKAWKVNEVTYHNNRYWYSIQQSNNTPFVGSSDWGGHTPYGSANEIVPHFFWIPSYAPSINSEPTVNIVKFGDGYEQRSPENINSNLLKVSLNFDKRDEAETKAISHFLHQRGAQEAFVFTPPSPYNSMKKFVCRSWDVTMNFQNNYSISATIEEVVD